MASTNAPLDPRLLRLSSSATRFVVGAGLLQSAATAAVVARGILVGTVAAAVVVTGDVDTRALAVLLGVVAVHAVLRAAQRRWADHCVAGSIVELRTAGIRALWRGDPREAQAAAPHWRVALGPGLEDLRPYFRDYLPALVSLVIATPVAWAVVWHYDRTSGWFALATLPLIPIFMVLIGSLTADHTKARLQSAAQLDARLSDLLRGALTLARYRRVQTPRRQLEELGTRHARTTMGVLRLAFLSGFFLEFLATLSVALIAVSIGLRLVGGDVELRAALIVLIIAPEVFAPLRAVGANFHAAADGRAAAQEVLDLCDRAKGTQARPGYLSHSSAADKGCASASASESRGIKVQGLTVTGRDGAAPRNLSFTALPGEVTVLSGPNGSGKSTALLAIGGLLPASIVEGTIETPAQVAYLPAAPSFQRGTVGENLALLGADARRLPAACAEVGQDLDESAEFTVSTGQAQRIALARTLAHPHAECLLFDEPSAHLSPELVEKLAATLRARAREGATVLVASHDPRILAIADREVILC